MGLVKAGQKLGPGLYVSINEAWVKMYGENAGWAHQILFAGDLAQFKDKVESKKREKIEEK